MFNHTLLSVFLAMSILACAGEDTTAPDIQCAAGTTLNTAGDTCELNLAEGVSVSASGEIVADTADTEAALAAARAEGVASVDITTDNQAAFDEGAASVDITTDNQTAYDEGAASVDITTDNQAAREEGRLAGVASVTPLNCADGTAVNAAGDACEPTAEYRAAAVEEGRIAGVDSVDITANDADVIAAATADLFTQAQVDAARQDGVDSVDITTDNQASYDEGAASVTPLNCGLGTGENDAGDACEPNLSMDVVIDDVDAIVPTDAYAAQVCADGGGTFDAATGVCAPAYDCFRGGFCSEAAAEGWFTAQQGNLYDGDTLQSSGCVNTYPGMPLWFAWREVRLHAEELCTGN